MQKIDERTEIDLARVIYNAGEAGMSSFLFAALKDAKKGQAVLHIQQMNFDAAFSSAILLLRHVIAAHLKHAPLSSKQYHFIFKNFEADLDRAVAVLTSEIKKLPQPKP